jgi:hypothetical protein
MIGQAIIQSRKSKCYIAEIQGVDIFDDQIDLILFVAAYRHGVANGL